MQTDDHRIDNWFANIESSIRIEDLGTQYSERARREKFNGLFI